MKKLSAFLIISFITFGATNIAIAGNSTWICQVDTQNWKKTLKVFANSKHMAEKKVYKMFDKKFKNKQSYNVTCSKMKSKNKKSPNRKPCTDLNPRCVM